MWTLEQVNSPKESFASHVALGKFASAEQCNPQPERHVVSENLKNLGRVLDHPQ
jgi:hypothetical protein